MPECNNALLSIFQNSGQAENFRGRTDRNDFDPLFHLGCDILEVIEIFLRDEYFCDPGALCGHQLLRKPADRRDGAPERDFAGHRDMGVHNPARKERCQRGRQGNAGGRTVLRDCACGHVDMQVVVRELLRILRKQGFHET